MRRTRLVRLLAAPAGGTAEGPSHPATSAAMLLEGSTVRCPWLLHAGPYLGRRSSTLTVLKTLRARPQDGAAGGIQAANALQPDSSSRHTTTANPKVRSTIPASPLVTGRRCLRSHGRDHESSRLRECDWSFAEAPYPASRSLGLP